MSNRQVLLAVAAFATMLALTDFAFGHGNERFTSRTINSAAESRRLIALNRLMIRPGDIIDPQEFEAIPKVKRLRAADLFQDQPRIIVLPPARLDLDSSGQKR